MTPMRLAVVVATTWWGPRHVCGTSLRGSGDASKNTEEDFRQPPFPLPPVPNLLAFGDIRDDPIAEVPGWLPRATSITKQEGTKREHYWLVALGAELFVGASAAQFVVWAVVLARQACRSRYQRVSADDTAERSNQTDDQTPSVGGQEEGGDGGETGERQDQGAATDPTTHVTEPETSTADAWSVAEEWGLISSMNSTLVAVILSAIAVRSEAISPSSGLDWELWSAFVLWNIAESLVQAAVRGYTVNVDLPLKNTFVFQHVVKMNLPVLSPRVDTVKDIVFTITCVARGATRLALLSFIVIVVNCERTWAVHRLRAEVREEALPLLKPTADVIDTQTSGEDQAGVLKRAFKQVLQIAQEMSTPLKIESAMWEDFPQTVLQIVFIANYTGAFFTKVSAAIGIIKIAAVVLMPPVILEKTKPNLAYSERHVMGSAFAQNRRRAAESIGRWLEAAASQHSQNIEGIRRAVHALQHALADETESENVKAASALSLITNATFLYSIHPALGRSVQYAFDFISDKTSKGKIPKVSAELFTKALQMLMDKEMITNHEGTCKRLIKLTGRLYISLEKPLRLKAIAAICNAGLSGSDVVVLESERFLRSFVEKDTDEGAFYEAVRRMYCGDKNPLIYLANTGPSELRELSLIVAVQALNADSVVAADVIFQIKGTDDSKEERAAALATLKDILSSHGWYSSSEAATALGRIGSMVELSPEVISAVAQALDDETVEVRVAAAGSIFEFKGTDNSSEQREAALAVLKEAMHDKDPSGRLLAAEALGRIGSGAGLRRELIDTLVQAAQSDGYPGVRAAAVEALGKVGSKADLPHESIRAVEHVATNHPDGSTRADAIFAMTSMQQYSPELALGLKNNFGDNSKEDIAIIGYFASMNKLSDLSANKQELIDKCVQNFDNHVTAHVASSLGQIGKELGNTAVPCELLMDILEHKSGQWQRAEDREACAVALEWVGKPDQTRTALEKAAETDPDRAVRAAAKNTLEKLTSSSDPEVSFHAPQAS